MPCLLTLFGQNSTTHRFLREHPQENQDYNHARTRKPLLPAPATQMPMPTTSSPLAPPSSPFRRPCTAAGSCGGSRSGSLSRVPQKTGAADQRVDRTKGWLNHAWACIAVIRCTCLQYSAIGRAELQQRIQPQGSIPGPGWTVGPGLVHTSTYQYILSRTSLYCSLYHHVPPCTCSYLLVPKSTYRYIPVCTAIEMSCVRTYRYVLVCTILTFLVPPRIQKRMYWYVPVRTFLYCLVPGVQDSRWLHSKLHGSLHRITWNYI